MKRTFLLFCLFVSLLCGCTYSKHSIANELGIDISKGTEIYSSDSHGGCHGDGTSLTQYNYPDEEAFSNWKTFPADTTVETILYGIEDETSKVGPYLCDDKGNSLIPIIKRGYYKLIDKQEDKEIDILKRPSFNFILGVYDQDAHILYICKYDT